MNKFLFGLIWILSLGILSAQTDIGIHGSLGTTNSANRFPLGRGLAPLHLNVYGGGGIHVRQSITPRLSIECGLQHSASGQQTYDYTVYIRNGYNGPIYRVGTTFKSLEVPISLHYSILGKRRVNIFISGIFSKMYQGEFVYGSFESSGNIYSLQVEQARYGLGGKLYYYGSIGLGAEYEIPIKSEWLGIQLGYNHKIPDKIWQGWHRLWVGAKYMIRVKERR